MKHVPVVPCLSCVLFVTTFCILETYHKIILSLLFSGVKRPNWCLCLVSIPKDAVTGLLTITHLLRVGVLHTFEDLFYLLNRSINILRSTASQMADLHMFNLTFTRFGFFFSVLIIPNTSFLKRIFK